MVKPTIKRLDGIWYCNGLGTLGRGKTLGAAYGSWYRALSRKLAQRDSRAADLEAELTKRSRVLETTRLELSRARAAEGQLRPDEKWLAERICYYNQACIDLIWKEKRLPSLDEYTDLTGRGKIASIHRSGSR